MSLLASTQISKPKDEQSFERACLPLWRVLLNDPNVQLNGKRGTRQNGVDLYGYRNGNPNQLVGVQCKLKDDKKNLTDSDIRGEVRAAQTFEPKLKEYFILTTAPDTADLHQVARELTSEIAAAGGNMKIYVWGWETLSNHISEHLEAIQAFDPSYGVFGRQLIRNQDAILQGQVDQSQVIAIVSTDSKAILAKVDLIAASVDGSRSTVAVETILDAEIDEYRSRLQDRQVKIALELFSALLKRVERVASPRILFRIKANIGQCHLQLGDQETGARWLQEACAHCPNDSKARVNQVLALSAQEKFQEAMLLGIEHLRTDPTNEDLAAQTLQAASLYAHCNLLNEDNIDPISIVPSNLRNGAVVVDTHIEHLRRIGASPQWIELAKSAAVEHPENRHIRRHGAEAVIDEYARSDAVKVRAQLAEVSKKDVSAAVAVLEDEWSRVLKSDTGVRQVDIPLCHNLSLGYQILHQFDRALEVLMGARQTHSNDQELLKRAVSIELDVENYAAAEQLVSLLDESAKSAVAKFQVFSNQGRWSQLLSLVEHYESAFPESEKTFVRTSAVIADAKVTRKLNREALEKALSVADQDPRSLVLVSDFARGIGEAEAADRAYQNALSKVVDSSSYAERWMLAHYAMKIRDWRAVIRLLNGHVALDHETSELKWLVSAYVNSIPVRREGVQLLDGLNGAFAEGAFYARSRGLMAFNSGDLESAGVWIKRALSVDPTDLFTILCLSATLRRQNDSEGVAELIHSLEVERLVGTPGELMQLAQEIRSIGEKERAIALGYRTLRSHPNDQTTVLRYFGLFLSGGGDEFSPPISTVQADAWVQIEDQFGHRQSFIIEDELTLPVSGDAIPTTHPLAASAMGLVVNETFTQPRDVGADRIWKIIEIKHKAVHVLHEAMEKFEAQFPDAKGFWRVPIKDDDLSGVLNEVRRYSERNREIVDLYLQNNIPLSALAHVMRGDPGSVADFVRFVGGEIQTCLGGAAERDEATKRIVSAIGNGAVLDTYTINVVQALGCMDVLKRLFGKVLVAQSSVDEFVQAEHREGLDRGQKMMTIGWHNGQYVRHEYSSEEIEGRVNQIHSIQSMIKENCESRPVQIVGSQTALEEMLFEKFGSHVLDSVYLAKEHGVLLISEDRYFRELATFTADVQGVWLQAVLRVALERREINLSSYAKMMAILARLRHTYVSVDASALIELVKANGNLSDFTVMANWLGAGSVDWPSHVGVCCEFLVQLWKSTIPIVLADKATCTVLSALCRKWGGDWEDLLGTIVVRTSGDLSPRAVRKVFLQCVHSWAKGHFLNIAKLQKAVMATEASLRG